MPDATANMMTSIPSVSKFGGENPKWLTIMAKRNVILYAHMLAGSRRGRATNHGVIPEELVLRALVLYALVLPALSCACPLCARPLCVCSLYSRALCAARLAGARLPFAGFEATNTLCFDDYDTNRLQHVFGDCGMTASTSM